MIAGLLMLVGLLFVALPLISKVLMTFPGIEAIPIVGDLVAWAMGSSYIMMPVGVFLVALIYTKGNFLYSFIAAVVAEVIFILMGLI